jgi:hypothetical protein
MACKSAPTVNVERVTLEEGGEVIVEASLSDYVIDGTLLAEIMNGYIEAVCILSTDKDFDIRSDVLDDKYHWEVPEWYGSYIGDDTIIGERIARPETEVTFSFSGLPTNLEYLSFYTYIQVNTQEIEDNFGINVPLSLENMTGDYTDGTVIDQCEVTSQAPITSTTDEEGNTTAIIPRSGAVVDTIRHFDVIDFRTDTCAPTDTSSTSTDTRATAGEKADKAADLASGLSPAEAEKNAKKGEERETPEGGGTYE